MTEPTRWAPETRSGSLLRHLEGDVPAGARQRVWSRLNQPARTPWLAWATALAATGALVVALVRPAPEPPAPVVVASVESLQGRATASNSTLQRGDHLGTGNRIRAHQGARVLLDGTGGVRAVVGAGAEVELGSMGDGIAARVRRGTALWAVVERPPGARVRVLAGVWEVEVIGTVFEIARPAPDGFSVRVIDGTVRVRGPNVDRLVGTGDTFSTGDQRVPEPDRISLGWLGFTVSEEMTPEEVAVVPEEMAQVATSSSERPEPRSARANEAPGERERRLYKRAMQQTDPRSAIQLLDRVVDMGGAWATIAAYEAARRASELDAEEAIARFTAYLSRHPAGLLAPEARLSLIELYVTSQQRERANQELDRFLDEHPTNERAGEAHFLKADLLRPDCQRALPHYQAAAAGGRRAEEALYWQAWCEGELGQREQARATLRAYLDRYPDGAQAAEAESALR